VVGCQPYAPAVFTPEMSWYSFLEAESTPSTWNCRISRNKSPVTTPGIDPGTFRLVAQCLNHYATPSPTGCQLVNKFPAFLEHEISLPHSQLPSACPYSEPPRSSPYSPPSNSCRSISHLPNLMSLIRCLDRTKVSIRVWGKCF
jgi:hypothetical protein